MRKIRVGDTVIVRAGRDKGKTGEIISIKRREPRIGDKLVVRGINMISKHVKPDPQQGITGGIEKQEASIHISNVSLVHPEDNKPSRVKILKNENGFKHRAFTRGDIAVDNEADIERNQGFTKNSNTEASETKASTSS